MRLAMFLFASVFMQASAAPMPQPISNVLLSASDVLANGQAAQKLNAQFASLSVNGSCSGVSIYYRDVVYC